MEELNSSLNQYKDQLVMVNQALENVSDETERGSLVTLQSDLQQLIQLTQENLDSIETNSIKNTEEPKEESKVIDDEYALFMEEMAKSGAYESESAKDEEASLTNNDQEENNADSDIEDELASLLGMKCAVYHTHKWGGQPTLHNAMVSSVVPRQGDDQFKDLQVQVRVLFTHPTHTEMLPCPFFLDGECKFSDEQCRYSHGSITQLSSLKEAIEPSFDGIKPGTRILMKLKPPDDEDITVTKKSTEKYHLWHRAVITSVDLDKKVCSVKLEQGAKSGDKRKATADEYNVRIEDIFPLNTEDDDDSSSDDSLSDTEYPDSKSKRIVTDNKSLIVENLQNNAPAMGEWERHTRGIGSKLMLAMGYVPGGGLGAAGEGRVLPVEARLLPAGKSLDQCMAISERNAGKDPMKVEQRLKRLQKKEEERNKRAYEREKEKERRNVFNFINRTLGDDEEPPSATPSINVKDSTSKDLNIEQFKITEDVKKIEREVIKLNSSLVKYPSGTPGYRSIAVQIAEKTKELDTLRRREQQISKEQKQRKDKAKMTVF